MAFDINKLIDDFVFLSADKQGTDGIWREKPVTLMEFVTSKDFLNERPYPGKQTEMLEKVNHVLWWKLDSQNSMCPDELKKVTEMVFMYGKGCKHGDTRIFDVSTGKMHTFEELAKDSLPLCVKSLDEEMQQLVDSTSTGVVEVGEGELFEIITNSGRRTKVYSEHLFLTQKYSKIKNGKYKGLEWKKVRELKVGDNIAVSIAPITYKGIYIDPRELKLVGFLLGDSNIYDPWKCSFYASIKEVEEEYCNILRSYEIEPKYPSYGNEGSPDRNCVMIDVSLTPQESRNNGGNPITNITRKYGIQGCNAYNKKIPREFFDLNKEGIVTFISALFATDGWVCLIDNRIPQIGYCSVSRELVEGIQLLLSKIGIYSRITEKKINRKFGKVYQLTISSKIDFLKFCDTIKIIGKADKQKEISDKIRSTMGKVKSLDKDIRFEKVVAINSIGIGKYYDLTVPDYANYVSDGFIDHNSGKDFLVSCILAYICYLLCCMNDPHAYFGFGKDEPIDIINVATNAYQANNVFFKKLKARFTNCPWFKEVSHNPSSNKNAIYNEFQITKNQIRFYKNITCHSAHSEADSYEGFSPLVVIFDEIGDFEYSKAEECYKTLRTSAVTRFKNRALLMFISFPRAADDFMMKKYNEAVENKDPEVYAERAATWEVNTSKTRADFEKEYRDDPEGARMRLECIPPKYRDGFFQFPERIDECIELGKTAQCPGLLIQDKITERTINTGEKLYYAGLEIFNLNLNPSYVYYLGGDGGVTSDSYILCLVHAEPQLVEVIENGVAIKKWINIPVEDLILEWRPSKKDRLPVDLLNVADVVEMICKQVFVKKALFDKFNSAEVVQRLISYGVDAEDKNWSNPFQLQLYQNFKNLIYSKQVKLLDYKSRFEGVYKNVMSPNDELKAIKIINGVKIDHDRDKSKDFSDARAAAMWICSMDEPEAVEHWSMPTILGVKFRR